MTEERWEDAREIYRDAWKDWPEADLLKERYRVASKARGDGFAHGYHTDVMLAVDDILRSRV